MCECWLACGGQLLRTINGCHLRCNLFGSGFAEVDRIEISLLGGKSVEDKVGRNKQRSGFGGETLESAVVEAEVGISSRIVLHWRASPEQNGNLRIFRPRCRDHTTNVLSILVEGHHSSGRDKVAERRRAEAALHEFEQLTKALTPPGVGIVGHINPRDRGDPGVDQAEVNERLGVETHAMDTFARGGHAATEVLARGGVTVLFQLLAKLVEDRIADRRDCNSTGITVTYSQHTQCATWAVVSVLVVFTWQEIQSSFYFYAARCCAARLVPMLIVSSVGGKPVLGILPLKTSLRSNRQVLRARVEKGSSDSEIDETVSMPALS